jgi:hypothetical protein
MISGTTTGTGTITIAIKDEYHQDMNHTITLQPIDNSSEITKVLGNSAIIDSTTNFFGIEDGLSNMFSMNIADVITNSTTEGTHANYYYDGSKYVIDGSAESFDVVSTTANTATLSHGSLIETVVFSDAKEVTSVNGTATAGLKQVTATWTVIEQKATVETSTDWWECGYTVWNQATQKSELINSLSVLRDNFLSTSNYGGDIWINDNLKVKLVGTTSSTSGTLVEMVWDGTYSTYTSNGVLHTYKHLLTGNSVTNGTWEIKTINGIEYLIANVPNQGTSAFKVETTNGIKTLMSTDISAVGTTFTETLYYGVPIETFNSVLESIIARSIW